MWDLWLNLDELKESKLDFTHGFRFLFSPEVKWFDLKPTCNLSPPQASTCTSAGPRRCISVDNHKQTLMSNPVASSAHVFPHNWSETTDPQHTEWFKFITTPFRKVLLWIMIESHILMTCLINWLNERLDFPLPWFAINHLSTDLKGARACEREKGREWCCSVRRHTDTLERAK